MNAVKRIFRNERGFLLLNVIFLTLITSFAAMFLFHAAPRAQNLNATLQLTAFYLANEQFAQLESLAAAGNPINGSYSFQGDPNDLTSTNSGPEKPTTFAVETQVSGNSNMRNVKITITWTVDDEDFELETERTIRVVQQK